MKSTFYGDFHLCFTGLLNKSRNPLDFRTTASSVGPKEQNKYETEKRNLMLSTLRSFHQNIQNT